MGTDGVRDCSMILAYISGYISAVMRRLIGWLGSMVGASGTSTSDGGLGGCVGMRAGSELGTGSSGVVDGEVVASETGAGNEEVEVRGVELADADPELV